VKSASRDRAASHDAVQEAVDLALGGDREAFGQLVRLLEARVYGLTLMVVRDPWGAAEVTQDAFVRAFRKFELYDQRRPFYPWIAAIAVRLSQTWLRRNARRQIREGTELGGAPEPRAREHPLEEIIADEEARILWRAVAGLPSGERTAVYMYYRDELGVEEIAHALGIATGTVKTFLFRARRKLRRVLGPARSRTQIKKDVP